MKKIFLLFVLLGILIAPEVICQELPTTRQDTIYIDPIVITATRTNSKLQETPVRIHILSANALVTTETKSVDEVLKYIPGVNVNRSFGVLSTKSTVSMRGLSGKEQGRVLVLLDGIPLNKSDGGTVDWNMIDLDEIERIEVVKGAGSSIYGGSAMGGMINIVTQKPDKKFSLKGSLDYGSYNTAGARIGASGLLPLFKSKEFYWSISSFYRQSDGYITQSEAERRENPYIINSNMQEAGINVRAGINFSKDHSLEAYIKYYDDCRGTGEKVHQPKGNSTDHDSYGLVLNYKLNFNDISFKSSAYVLNEDYKKVNEYLKDDYTWYNVLSTRNDIGWLNAFSKKIDNHSLTAGFDLKNGSVDGEDVYLTSTDIVYNRGKIFTAALFIQDELKLSDRFNLIAGLRYDNATFYDGAFSIENPSNETSFMYAHQVPDMPRKNRSAFSPRISVQYKLNEKQNRIYALFSRGFRPAELEYLCRSGRIKGGFKIASPSLKPEFLYNVETGIDYSLMPDMFFSLSAYYSRGKDFQYYVSNGDVIDMGFGSRPVFIRENLGGVDIFGTEVELNYNIISGLMLNASYAWSYSNITDYETITASDTINLNGRSFTDVPEHMVNFGLKYINKFINGNLFVHYTGSMFVNDQNSIDEIIGSDKYDAYTTIDVKLWKNLNKNIKLSLGVQNLLDVKFYDSKYSVGPGRWFTLGVEYKM